MRRGIGWDPLPETMFGQDTDELFGYTTKKVVWVRDRWIGILYYFLVFLVVCWVIGGQILYRNEHFLRKDVSGITRMWYSHPTRNQCEPTHHECHSDYRSLEDLPYCAGVYTGDKAVKFPVECHYEDKTTMIPTGEVDNKLFLTTSVELITEKLHCKPTSENGHECENVYVEEEGTDCMMGTYMCRKRGGKENQFYYVADVESFVIQLTSSYERDWVTGTSLEHPGSYQECRRARGEHQHSRLRKHEESGEEMGKVDSWVNRMKEAGKACEDPKIHRIECLPGIACAQEEKFDVLKSTGIKDGLKDAGKATGLEEEEEEEEGEEEKAAEDSEASSNAASFLGHQQQLLHTTPRFFAQDPVSGGHTYGHPFPSRGPGHWPRRKHRAASLQQAKGNSSTRLLQTPRAAASPTGASTFQHHLENEKFREALAEFQRSKKAGAGPAEGEDEYRPTPDQYSSAWGDTFKLGRLLQLAGTDLDADFNRDGWSARQAGTVLEVRVVYNNLYPFLSSFGYKPVEYHYEVRELVMPYVSRQQLAEIQPEDYPNTRTYEVRHGVMIWFSVSGTFGFFNVVYFLLMLTTGFALMASAISFTDIFSVYIHPRRRNFFHLKYEITPDFSEMWQCEKCLYWNSPEATKCAGIDMWISPAEGKPCGHPRGEAAPS